MKNDINPLISIVTVSYNAVSTIEQTIQSVINQTYSNIEYIIIDGGSTDGTVDVIKKYQDKVTFWVSEPDKGIYDAMNKGLSKAYGDWAIFMGSDDIFYNSNVLTLVVDRLLYKDGIYYGNTILKNSGKIYPLYIKNTYQLCLKNFSHQAIFYPVSVYKKYSYQTEYKLWADYVYNLKLYSYNRSRFYYLNLVISVFNDNGRGSINKDFLFVSNRLNLIEELFGKKMRYIMNFRYKLSELIHGL